MWTTRTAVTVVSMLLAFHTAMGQEKPGNLTNLDACKVSHMGLDYMGYIRNTEGNVRCQSWASKTPQHKVDAAFTDDKFPEFSKEKAKNYCRNPSRDPNGPWCYSMDPQLIDDTCAVPLCSLTECKLTGPGMEYAGVHNRAATDEKCLKWDKNRKKVRVRNDTVVRIDKFSKYRFPEFGVGAAKKFCRNPDGDLGGPWCFVEADDYVEKRYCDIPFCIDYDCMVFSRNPTIYSHYIAFPKQLNNFTFGLKLWNPDSYLDATAKLALTLLALPVSGQEIDDLGIGLEFHFTNKKSALVYGNYDKPEYETTFNIMKSTEFTFFSLMWDRGYITLQQENHTKPVFLQQIKLKNNLMGQHKDQFHFYAAKGANVMWSFPFCDDENECDVHTTTSSKLQSFWPLRETDVGHDVAFHVRAFHSAYIVFVSNPINDFPNVKLMLSKIDNYTRITYTEYEKGPTVTLKEDNFKHLIDYWKWNQFSVTVFSDSLTFYWTRDVGTFTMMEVKHDAIRLLRWFSISSENGLAHWTLYCTPPAKSHPPPAYLPECALTPKEMNYAGVQDVTSTGLPCLPWSGKKLLPTDLVKSLEGNIKETLKMKNYCRDLEGEHKGTFCYAVSELAAKRVDKRYCRIRKCKSAECRMAGTGNDYIGKVNTTRSNRTCQYWDAATSIESVQNYFKAKSQRVPDLNVSKLIKNPTVDAGEHFRDARGNLVKIPVIRRNVTNKYVYARTVQNATSANIDPDLVEVSETIKDYLQEGADANLVHVQVHVIPYQWLNETLFPDMSSQKAENFCRNPSRTIAGPWCYTMDVSVPQDLCNVPDCDKNEECSMYLTGSGQGRDVFILPQWKESGMHGGLRFSVKQWNPDITEGLEIQIRSFKADPHMTLRIGANNNEQVVLLKQNVIVMEKTLPHLIPAGKWMSFWLQIRQGELLLGYEGVTETLFEWISPEKHAELLPIFLSLGTISGNPLGLFLNCEECHLENTTVRNFGKVQPIGIWTRNERIVQKNLTLYVRGIGNAIVRLMRLPGSSPNYDLSFLNSGSEIALIKDESEKLIDAIMGHPILTNDSWLVVNVTFAEHNLKVFANDTLVLNLDSKTPLLFYYFAVASANGWFTWVANCDPLDIDGPPTDGGWSNWSPWVCTVTCGGGDGYRTRTCSNPRPNVYGHLCEGNAMSTGKCNEFECGDISPETMEDVRLFLQSKSVSFVLREGESAVMYNNPVILRKIARESPESRFDWTLNGKFIEIDENDDHILLQGDDLVVKRAHWADTGVYICMLHRINDARLILQVGTVAVVTKKWQIDTRATLSITIDCKSVSLGYVYTDLSQKWLLNDTTFLDYGVTTLAATNYQVVNETNMSMTGEWRCVVEQPDLGLRWVTSIINVRIKKRPNIYTHLMEDPATRWIFGRLKSDKAVLAVLITLIVVMLLVVWFGVFAYLRWCTLPERKSNRRKKKHKNRNRRY